ncbi:MAG: M23 family metallopeptidase, partial [Clostridia bacterium]|nr:M23 family metallopeptidase [Clostridia bacterium]
MLNPYKGGEFRVTSPYGTRAFEGGEEFHFGLDLVGESGKELLSICNGRVIQSRIVSDKSNITWQWGNYIIIQAETGERVIYAHLSKRFVFLGDKVKKGDVIGIEGNTGYCFGSHCHLEVRDTENRVTTEVNTPAYTKIPNKTGKYKIKEEKNMTSEETQAMINAS